MTRDQLVSLSADKREKVARNAQRVLREGPAAKHEDAARILSDLAAIDADEKTLRADRFGRLSQGERVVEAFRALPASETEVRLIQVLNANPHADSPTLSAALGWAEGGGWHLHFGKMCSARSEYLWPGPFAEKRNAEFYCGVLCDTSWETGTLTYALKPEVEEAYHVLGIL